MLIKLIKYDIRADYKKYAITAANALRTTEIMPKSKLPMLFLTNMPMPTAGGRMTEGPSITIIR